MGGYGWPADDGLNYIRGVAACGEGGARDGGYVG